MIGTSNKIITYLLEQAKDKQFELKDYHPKRSKTQNSYAWELMQKLADKLRTTKEEIYETMLDRYGQLLLNEEGNVVTITLSNKNDISQVEGHYKRIKSNDKFTAYAIIRGSSTYDSKEMTIFIDGIISECKLQDIETLTPQQVAGMRLK